MGIDFKNNSSLMGISALGYFKIAIFVFLTLIN